MTEAPRGYVQEAIRRILATDPRILEPELEVEILGDSVVIRGVVPTRDRRRAIRQVLSEHPEALGRLRVIDRTEVANFPPPPAQERIG